MSSLAELVPDPDVRSRHAVEIAAPPAIVWETLHATRLDRSPLVALLLRLRGLPRSAATVAGLERLGFVRLHEVASRELVLGVVGWFWMPTGGIRRIAAEDFAGFAEPGYACAGWSFELEPLANGVSTRAVTMTRVRTTDPVSRRRFARYWRIVGPFSGLIRRRMLEAIRIEAEARVSRIGTAVP